MVYVKKQAYEAVVQKLESELAIINRKIHANKREFVKLSEEQAKMKRERGIISSLIRGLKGERHGD